MKKIMSILVFCVIGMITCHAIAQPIAVYVAVRGNTGREAELKTTMEEELAAINRVEIIQNKEDCHVYLDLSLVEQEPIRFYGLGISIAYKITENLYSRPTSDVAQFGYEKMKDVCVQLVKEIDKGFLDPLKQPIE
ncbi:MAG: hypothetical protein P9L90_02385 [Candidatus Aadella gelida]|nr:hypothetical protein [Candidatus Aadella gelida]